MRLVVHLEGRQVCVRQVDGFTRSNREILEAISPDSKWEGHRLTWSYPYTSGVVAGLDDAAQRLSARLEMPAELAYQLSEIRNETASEKQVRTLIQKYLDDHRLPLADYPTQPLPPPWWHQRVAWHWAQRVRAIYFQLKPGLGKTRIGADVIRGKQSLGQIRAPEQVLVPERESCIPGRMLPERWCLRGGVLVVCPRVVVGEWLEQLYRWQNVRAVTITGSAERKRYRAGIPAWVHICGYDSLESVESNEYDGIIGDELHYIANDESNRFTRMMALRSSASWVLGLSGTPISNMLPSLWSQYYWLDYGRTLGPSFAAYKQKYFNKEGRRDVEKVGAEIRVSQAISRITMVLSMQEAFPDKAHKIHQVIRVPMTPEQARYYEALRSKQAADIIAGKVTMVEATTRLLKLLEVTQGFVIDDEGKVQQFSSAKLHELEKMVTGSGDLTDRRTIIWCRFRHDAVMVQEMLKKHGVKHMSLNGDMTDREKEQTRDGWNSDHTQRVLVGMIQMGIGINLHAPNCVDDKGKPSRCSTTVYYGLDWRVTQLEQSMDRTYRGDQVETCLYRYLLSEDLDESDDDGNPIKPIDVRVYESLQAKLDQAVRISEESVDYVRSLLALVA